MTPSAIPRRSAFLWTATEEEPRGRSYAQTAHISCRKILVAWFIVLAGAPAALAGPKVAESQPAEPGDEMIHAYLAGLATQLDAGFNQMLPKADEWDQVRSQWKQEYLYMLGLWPLAERSLLNAVITGTLQGDGYVVDKLYFESRPHLYVTANLYRPANVPAGTKLPAVLYVCGHSNCGPVGVKVGYQCHPIWFAKHGYVCLIVDTLSRGEIKGVHRGLYSEGRRWWLSRGYTPAGVECWNGIRAIDYLVSRPDVDAGRIAVTGISGGGASSFWIAAADERVKVAVPISGMSDLQFYVGGNGVDRHCDCMLLHNTFEWPWTRIAALVAPRPVLLVNSDHDELFPVDGNERIINRLERLYGILGAGDMVDAVVSVGEHAYRKDIRQAVFRFINMHLKGDPSIVTDSEQDLYQEEGDKRTYPIDPKDLCVFPDCKGIPADQLNATIDEHFVPMAKVEPPAAGRFDAWKKNMLAELRRVTFRTLPDRVPAAQVLADLSPNNMRMVSEEGIAFHLINMRVSATDKPLPVIIVIDLQNKPESYEWLDPVTKSTDWIFVCQPRGVGDTRWNTQSPPNRVERECALVGRTVDAGRVWDVIATARYLAERRPGTSILVAGERAAGVLAAYAALLEPEIAGVIIKDPPASHMDPAAPQFLNVLRVCDVPEALGMIAPRPLTIMGGNDSLVEKIKVIYTAAGAVDRLALRRPG